jgi:hypothetical protein
VLSRAQRSSVINDLPRSGSPSSQDEELSQGHAFRPEPGHRLSNDLIGGLDRHGHPAARSILMYLKPGTILCQGGWCGERLSGGPDCVAKWRTRPGRRAIA